MCWSVWIIKFRKVRRRIFMVSQLVRIVYCIDYYRFPCKFGCETLERINMNELQTFNFNNQPVRTVQLNNQPYWVLKDVCAVLGISNSRMTAERLEDDEVSQTDITRSMTFKSPILRAFLYIWHLFGTLSAYFQLFRLGICQYPLTSAYMSVVFALWMRDLVAWILPQYLRHC